MENVIFDTIGTITDGEKKAIAESVKTIVKEGDSEKIVLQAFLILLARGASSTNASGNIGFYLNKNRYVLSDFRRIVRAINDSATMRQVSRGFANETKVLLETNKITPALSIKAKLNQDEIYWGFDGASYGSNCPAEVKTKLDEYLETVKSRK